MGADLKKQLHRLALFLGTWSFAGVLGYFWARSTGYGPDTGFGKLLNDVADIQTLLIGVLVPLGGAVFAFLIWLGARRNSKAGIAAIAAEAWRDMEEFGNDAVAVIYNALSLAGAALFVCFFLGVNNERAKWVWFGAAAWGIAFMMAHVYSRLPEAWKNRSFHKPSSDNESSQT